MTNLQDTMITKLREHYSSPDGEFNDLMAQWVADNSISSWSADDANSYQSFILANSSVDGGFIERQYDYWVNVYDSVFNPLTAIDWSAAYWAEDPDWTPPADGGQLVTIRDAGTKAANLSVESGSAAAGTYVAASANLNDKPVYRLADAVSYGAAWGTAIGAATTVTLVAIIYAESVEESGILGVNANSPLFALAISSGITWQIYRGGNGTGGGTPEAGKYLLWGVKGASPLSYLELNGTALASGGSQIAQELTGIRMGRYFRFSSFYFNGDIAFAGVFEGEVDAEDKADFEAWASDHYGITIS